jgi:arylsulfatase A-like enzyme
MRRGSISVAALLVIAGLKGVTVAQAVERPNILVILADDLGYADVGFQGCKDIPTPNLDKLAARSVRCSQGYVTHPFCSPTRAGLLTGRYQQRFGHENNPVYDPADTKAGLPVDQTTIADVLRTAGYKTGCVGKWHLGAHPQFHPNRRGFDEYFGHIGGGHVYLPDAKGGAEYKVPLDRNGTSEPLVGYLTEVLGNEAAAYIDRHNGDTWFLYLAFNAPHSPLQITAAQVERVKHIEDETRRGYAGLVIGLDDAIGRVLAQLDDTKQTDNTLVFFMSDNGGPCLQTHADNTPLRGQKGMVFEGGVRVPYLVSWPAKLPRGTVHTSSVNSLDVFATAAAIAGAKDVPDNLDGVNLLPQLLGKPAADERDYQFWRTGGGVSWAVRGGRYKLVHTGDGPEQLFDLMTDVAEANDIADKRAPIVERLLAAYQEWNAKNIKPVFQGPQRPSVPKKAKAVEVESQ